MIPDSDVSRHLLLGGGGILTNCPTIVTILKILGDATPPTSPICTSLIPEHFIQKRISHNRSRAICKACQPICKCMPSQSSYQFCFSYTLRIYLLLETFRMICYLIINTEDPTCLFRIIGKI